MDRGLIGIAAAALAALAAVVASLDGDADIVPFFIGLTMLGALIGWGRHEPYGGPRRLVARIAALAWLGAAAWAGVLLLWYVTSVAGGSGPEPGPEATYLGLPGTAYHLLGLFGGAALAVFAAFGPGRDARISDRAPGDSR